MPQAKRERRERTDNYHLLQQWCRTPEQCLYEGIRPVVLFGITPAERAAETGLAERSLGRAADAFDTHGIVSLFRPTKFSMQPDTSGDLIGWAMCIFGAGNCTEKRPWYVILR